MWLRNDAPGGALADALSQLAGGSAGTAEGAPPDLPLAVVDGVNTASPVTYQVHTDHLGRPIRMTDAAKATVWQATWKPWGEPVSITGTAVNNLRFPGQYFKIETGLAYNWHRSYDPVTGRYTQPDPLRFIDGPSVFAYVKNSPFMRVDTSGWETSIVVWNGGPGGFTGAHSGIVNTGQNSDGNAVYDPSGTTPFPEGGSGRLATGPDAPSLGSYTGANCDCTVYSFPTTPDEETRLVDRMRERDGGGAFAQCTWNVRTALSGIGPFKNLGGGGPFSWPSILGKELGRIPGVRKGKGDLK